MSISALSSSCSSSSSSFSRPAKRPPEGVSSNSSTSTQLGARELPNELMQTCLSVLPFQDFASTSQASRSWRLNTTQVSHDQLFESFEKFVAFLKLHFLDETSQKVINELSNRIAKRKEVHTTLMSAQENTPIPLVSLSLEANLLFLRNCCLSILNKCSLQQLRNLHGLNQQNQYSVSVLKNIFQIVMCCKQIQEICRPQEAPTQPITLNQVMLIIETLFAFRCPDLAIQGFHLLVKKTVSLQGAPTYRSYECLKKLLERSLRSGQEDVAKKSLIYMSQVLSSRDLLQCPVLMEALRNMIGEQMRNRGIEVTVAFIKSCHPGTHDFGFSLIATAFIEQGKFDDAFHFFESIRKEFTDIEYETRPSGHDCDSMLALSRLVGCFLHQGRLDMAMRTFALIPNDCFYGKAREGAVRNILKYLIRNHDLKRAIAFVNTHPKTTNNRGQDIGFSIFHDFGFAVIGSVLMEQGKLEQALDVFRAIPGDQITLWAKSMYYSESFALLSHLAKRIYWEKGLETALEVLKLVHPSAYYKHSIKGMDILGVILPCLVTDGKVEIAYKILHEHPEEIDDWGLACMTGAMIEHDPDKGLMMLDSVSVISDSPKRRKFTPENEYYGHLIMQLSCAYARRGDLAKAVMVISKIVPSDYRDLCCHAVIKEAIRQGCIKEAFDILGLMQDTGAYYRRIATIDVVMAALPLGDSRSSLAKYHVGAFSSSVRDPDMCQEFYIDIMGKLVNEGQEDAILYIIERMTDVHYIALSLFTISKVLLRKGNVDRACILAERIPKGVHIDNLRSSWLPAFTLSKGESPLCLRQQMFKELASRYFSLGRMDEFAHCLSMISHEEERKKLLSTLEKLPQPKKAT